MSTWRMIRNIAKNKTQPIRDTFSSKKQEARVDLPLGIRLAGRIAIDRSTFVLGKRGQIPMQVQDPGRELVVVAYGRVVYEGATITRFYLQAPDAVSHAMLQVVEENGEVVESRLFCQHDEVFPEDDGEWAFWLDETDGYLGWENFSLRPEEFPGSEPPVYDRVWGDSRHQRTEPLVWRETMTMASADGASSVIDHHVMLYGRWVDEETETAEYALVSAEESPESASVNILLGVDLDPASIKIVY